MTREDVAFLYRDEDGNACVEQMRRDKITEWWDSQETLPRTRSFEHMMPESMRELLPVLDYAYSHGFGRFCIPTEDFTPTDFAAARDAIRLTYLVNNSTISANTSAVFPIDGGRTLMFLDMAFTGMEGRGSVEEYRIAMDRAREIVAGIPEGSGDYDRVLYIYRWLTENVTFADDDYYSGSWNLLYDALIEKRTLCAGYADSLYVMANLAGVDCIELIGGEYARGNWAGHSWNAAKIDGDYYFFDATGDAGRPVELYCFFGTSEETMQAYGPRMLYSPYGEACPPCTEDLVIPGAVFAPAELDAGTIEEGSYSQPFMDLELNWDGDWTAPGREEINRGYFGKEELQIDKLIREGIDYTDLFLQSCDETVEIRMLMSPLIRGGKLSCDSPESYLDMNSAELEAQLEEEGASDVHSRRFSEEICGRSYECLAISCVIDGSGTALTCFCTQKDNIIFSIWITAGSEEDCESVLRELSGQ